MGVFLAIALDAASPDGGWASFSSSASLLLATLTSLGLWLLGRRQARFASETVRGRSTPGVAEGVARRLAWGFRRLPMVPVPAPVTLLLPRSSIRPPLPRPQAIPGPFAGPCGPVVAPAGAAGDRSRSDSTAARTRRATLARRRSVLFLGRACVAILRWRKPGPRVRISPASSRPPVHPL